MTEVWPGRPFPLGATWDGGGTNFSIFSEHAEAVELCLFDDADNEQRIEIGCSAGALNWFGDPPNVGPGQAHLLLQGGGGLVLGSSRWWMNT